MISVDSASLESVGYDPAAQQLFVRFRDSARTYVYYAVEAHVFQELLSADSKGGFFNLRVRPCYKFRELLGTSRRRRVESKEH